MTLYARNDDDVEPEEIMRQVTKATANFTYIAPNNDYNGDTSKAVVSGITYHRNKRCHHINIECYVLIIAENVKKKVEFPMPS